MPKSQIAGLAGVGCHALANRAASGLVIRQPGIFSAVMIGFGRAIGETMIVLMATGNTRSWIGTGPMGSGPCRPTSPSKFRGAARRKSVPGACLAALLLFIDHVCHQFACGTRPSATPG